MRILGKTASIILLPLLLLTAGAAQADPPSHAPAHGWRKQHDPAYVGYSGKRWEEDYGIRSGECNRELVGTVVGGVLGAVIGDRVADPEDRAVATIVGAVAGALIGNRIGRELDEADRACVGHALELAEPGQRVRWTAGSGDLRYDLVPGESLERAGRECREYRLVASTDERRSAHRGTACQVRPGVWQMID
jgi:surface antigen